MQRIRRVAAECIDAESSVRGWLPMDLRQPRVRLAFLAEVAELERPIVAGEEVLEFFVDAYPKRATIEKPNDTSFDLYRAELESVGHRSLTFAKS